MVLKDGVKWLMAERNGDAERGRTGVLEFIRKKEKDLTKWRMKGIKRREKERRARKFCRRPLYLILRQLRTSENNPHVIVRFGKIGFEVL